MKNSARQSARQRLQARVPPPAALGSEQLRQPSPPRVTTPTRAAVNDGAVDDFGPPNAQGPAARRGGRGGRAGRGGRGRVAAVWSRPEIRLNPTSPPNLRRRKPTRCTSSPNRSPASQRLRRGRGPTSPATTQFQQQRGQPVNLGAAFANAAHTEDWLATITELANTTVPTQTSIEGEGFRVQGRVTDVSTPPPRCHHHAAMAEGASTSLALPPPRPLVACVPGGHNSCNVGCSLPDEVWVPLHVLGYHPIQHGGLQDFMGEVCQGWFEDGVYWYGVDFGGSIGWRKVAQADCKTLDFLHKPLPPPYTTIIQGSPTTPVFSLVHDGSVGRLEGRGNGPQISESVLGSPAKTTAEAGDVFTPPRGPRRFGSIDSPVDIDSYAPLSHYEVWTSDSQDSSWMADFQDFAGNSSDEENCELLLLEDDDERLSAGESLDLEHYEEFCHLNSNRKLALEDIRCRYADEKWSHAHSRLLGDRAAFVGPCPGPTQRYTRHIRQPAYFFSLWWDTVTLETLVSQTNLYASQPCTVPDDPRRRGRPSGSNGGPKWKPVNLIEMRGFLGLVILMGLKGSATIRDYWKADPFWRCGLIPRVMTRNRFESLLRCLHCVDNAQLVRDKSSPLYDKLGKVRWILQHFVTRSRELFNCEKFVTADEIMIPFRGHFSPCRMYLPAKPTRYGFKVWAAVSNPSCYIYNIIPYTGKGDAVDEGQGERVVHELTEGLSHKGHVVVCDNFFTSPLLFDSLLQRGIYGTGTVKVGRVGYPSIFSGFRKDQHPRSTLFWQMHESQRMAATTWFDSKPVSFLSTSADPIGPGIALRWIKGIREEISTTPQQVEYQRYMRGVDLIDQMRRDYSVQFHSRKWWHKFLFFTIDSSLQNAWVLFKADREARGQGGRQLTRRSFYFNIAKQLVLPLIRPALTCNPHNKNPNLLHYSVAHPTARRRCMICKRKQNRHCRACGIYMCDDPCFLKAHTGKKWALRLSQ